MKTKFTFLLAMFTSILAYNQETIPLNKKHRSLLFEASTFTTSAGKGLCWSPSLVFVKNKNSFSVGGIFQQGKIFNENSSLIYTGTLIKYQRRLAFSDNYSEFFGEMNVAYRNATSNYEYGNLIEKLDIEVPLKEYNLIEYYAGFGFRSPLKHLFFWSAFIGMGGIHSDSFTEYNHEAIPYTISINDISLQLKASVGFRLLPKNNVQH
jgi:hypothetical protein